MRAIFALSLLLLVCAEDLPSWVPPPGSFANISLNFVKDVDPCPKRNCPYSPSDGVRAVFGTWNGGIYAHDYSKYGALIVHGGGHGGYNGNEAYAFDLETRLWNRIKYPSNYTEAQANSYGELPDGQPFCSHTYTGVAYLSTENGGGPKGSYLRIGFGGASVQQMMHRLPLDTPDNVTIAWSRWGPSAVMLSAGLHGGYWSATYDVRRRRFWIIAGGGSYTDGFGWVDINGNATLLPGQGSENWEYTGMVYSPSLDALVHIGYNGVPYLAGRYAGNETMGFKPIHYTGTFPANVRNFEWSTMGGYYVCYEGAGSYIVHKLIPPASGDLFTDIWTWVNETLTGVDGVPPAQLMPPGYNHGIWSRFREVPILSTPGNPTFVFADGEDQYVQLWRLSGTPPPPVDIPIAPVPPLSSPLSSSNPQSPSADTSPLSSSSPQSSNLSSVGSRSIFSMIAVVIAWLCVA